jgi:predicted O-linked N-acetylglucosamine transferase (SPINDLY family)
VLAAWAAAAAAVPDARVALAGVPDGSARARVLEAFGAAGVRAERVAMLPGMPRPEYYRFLSTLDIALDAFPYSGGTTTCDALWMGVPVVTLAGRHGSARSGASLLSAAGLGQCIAQSPPEYVAICAGLCADRGALAHQRENLRPRLEGSPLMDVKRFVAGLESLYREIAAA